MVSSPLFWVIAFILLAATLAILLLPLLRRSTAAEPPPDRTAATAVFRDHKRQIEDDFAARRISEAERDAAVADLTARFGQELQQDAPAAPSGSQRPRWIAALVVAACVPVVAGVLYFSLGNPSAITEMGAAHGGDQAMNDPQTVAMVDKLANRMQENPDDGEGWALLGRSYRALGRFDAAVTAYSEASKHLAPSAALYSDWAEAVAQAQGKSLMGQPTELLDRALKLDPTYPKALALAGSAAMERNDRATAVVMWKRLRAALPADSPDIAQVDSVLEQIGEAPSASSAFAGPAPGTASAAPRSSPSSSPAAKETTTGTGSVEGRVELDPKLANNVAPGDVVFIYARNPDGPRMPLAAMKLTGADLPKVFALTDAMAMTPAATISKAAKVVIEARVSKSGNVVAQSGDLSGTSAPVAPGSRDVRVTIDRVVP